MKIDPAVKSRIKKKIIEQIKNPQAREVVIKTPYKLAESELESIKKSFPELSKAQLVNTVDKELLGGLIIIDGSLIIDYSVKGKINEVIDTLLQS